MDERPVPQPALHILFHLGGVIERELDVMEGTQFAVLQDGDAVTVGSNGELDRLGAQVRQNRPEVGMHSVLACPQIHRTDGKPLHHRLDLFQGEAIGTGRIAITESTGEIAFVGKPQPQRNRIGGARDG